MYAAYGSNMHPEQMLQRAPHSPLAGTGWLNGWRLAFCGGEIGWEGALATVVEDPGSRVFVVLYDVPDEDVPGLDRWEGPELSLHRKIKVRIEPDGDLADGNLPVGGADSGPTLAWLYVLDAYEGGLPSARYLGVIADAAEIAGAPASYVRALRTRESRNVGPGPS